MHKLSRREALRGAGVAALAACGGAALPFVSNATDDPLLSSLNRYLAELAWIDSPTTATSIAAARSWVGISRGTSRRSNRREPGPVQGDAEADSQAASGGCIVNRYHRRIRNRDSSMGGLLLATPQVGQCVHRGGGAVMKDIYSIANELEMQVSNVNDLAQILYEYISEAQAFDQEKHGSAITRRGSGQAGLSGLRKAVRCKGAQSRIERAGCGYSPWPMLGAVAITGFCFPARRPRSYDGN